MNVPSEVWKRDGQPTQKPCFGSADSGEKLKTWKGISISSQAAYEEDALSIFFGYSLRSTRSDSTWRESFLMPKTGDYGGFLGFQKRNIETAFTQSWSQSWSIPLWHYEINIREKKPVRKPREMILDIWSTPHRVGKAWQIPRGILTDPGGTSPFRSILHPFQHWFNINVGDWRRLYRVWVYNQLDMIWFCFKHGQSDWLPIITSSIHPWSDTTRYHVGHKPWNTFLCHMVSHFMLHHFPLQKFHQNPMFAVKIPLKTAVSSRSISAADSQFRRRLGARHGLCLRGWSMELHQAWRMPLGRAGLHSSQNGEGPMIGNAWHKHRAPVFPVCFGMFYVILEKVLFW